MRILELILVGGSHKWSSNFHWRKCFNFALRFWLRSWSNLMLLIRARYFDHCHGALQLIIHRHVIGFTLGELGVLSVELLVHWVVLGEGRIRHLLLAHRRCKVEDARIESSWSFFCAKWHHKGFLRCLSSDCVDEWLLGCLVGFCYFDLDVLWVFLFARLAGLRVQLVGATHLPHLQQTVFNMLL